MDCMPATFNDCMFWKRCFDLTKRDNVTDIHTKENRLVVNFVMPMKKWLTLLICFLPGNMQKKEKKGKI